MRELRPYQAAAIDKVREALRSGSKRVMLQAPTGAGKTLLSAAIIAMARAKGTRVIFTVPAVELVDQTAREFYREGIRDVGVIQADHPMTAPERPVQIASVQSLARRRIPPAGLVIVDEAHRVFRSVVEWMGEDEWAGVPFVGLSATPWTVGLGRLYDKLVVAETTKGLIEAGYLSPFRVFAPSHPDLTGVRVTAGDYREDDLSGAMQAGTLTADIVSTWLQRGENRPTLCFAVDRAHARALQDRFTHCGVRCGYVDGLTPRDERDQVRDAFHRGDYQVVVNVGVLTTGVDWDVRCIILARPTKSEMLFCQIIGRGLRLAEGKQDCIVLDHSDTTNNLGFVTDIHHAKLSNGKLASVSEAEERERKERLPKDCPVCTALVPVGVRVCACGHAFAPPKRDIKTQDGELIELDAKRKAKANRELSWDEKAALMGQLRFLAEERGYAEGWAANQYRKKTGVWPNDPRVKHARAIEPTPEIRSWIKAQQIRWAKSRERAAS